MNQLANNESAHTRRLKVVEAIGSMGMTTAEAAAYAGLSTASVRGILKDERVVRYLSKVRQHQEKRFEIRRENVVEGILDAIGRAKMLGEPATEIRGWESLAKLQGLNAPERVIHDLPEEAIDLINTMKSMNTADVARIAGSGSTIELSEDDFRRSDGTDV